MKRLPDTVAVLILLVGLLIVCARILAGCSASQVGAGLDVAGHSAALARCRARGKDAGSFEVYENCADGVDQHFMDGGVR